MKCFHLYERILFVSPVLADSPPAHNLMNPKLSAADWRDARDKDAAVENTQLRCGRIVALK